MNRKIITYKVFENIQESSIHNMEHELREVQPYLAKSLNLEDVELVSYDNDTVMYGIDDGTYIYANYDFKDGYLQFENVTQLVLDEETEYENAKEVIGKMLDAIVENRKEDANELFNKYISLPYVERQFNEFKFVSTITTGRGRKSPFRGRRRPGGHAAAVKAARTRARNRRKLGSGALAMLKRLREKNKRLLGGRKFVTDKGRRQVRTAIRIKEHFLHEISRLCENASEFVVYQEFGPIFNEFVVNHDESGNLSSITIPGSSIRNQTMLNIRNWKTINSNLVKYRENAYLLPENNEFCKVISGLRSAVAKVDEEEILKKLDEVVSKWPSLLYLTNDELTSVVKESLENISDKFFDDDTCRNLSDRVLRGLHETYKDRVNKIFDLAGVREHDDKFESFKVLTEKFYPSTDSSSYLEMQLFVDIYESIRELRETAISEKNNDMVSETEDLLNNLKQVIEGKTSKDLGLVADALDLLSYVVETNLEASDWNVSDSVHVTDNGDHPVLTSKSNKSYTPAKDFEAGDEDNGDLENGLGKLSGMGTNPFIKDANNKPSDTLNKGLPDSKTTDVFPKLSNPYMPKGTIPSSGNLVG